jgi:hypothetical protein
VFVLTIINLLGWPGKGLFRERRRNGGLKRGKLLRSLVLQEFCSFPLLQNLGLEHVFPLGIGQRCSDLHRVAESFDMLQGASLQGRMEFQTTPFDIRTTSLAHGFDFVSVANGTLCMRTGVSW